MQQPSTAHLRSPPDTPRTKALPTNVSAALPSASSLITSSTSCSRDDKRVWGQQKREVKQRQWLLEHQEA